MSPEPHIDATEIIANKVCAKWTYNKNKGYMPMVGHIAETGQIVACDFRGGNTPPASENYDFILQCKKSLPNGCFIQNLRIDAAGYQSKIIQYCDDNNIQYAIRAKTNGTLKAQIEGINDEDWEEFVDKGGRPVKGQSTYRTSHCIGDYKKPFTLIIQRKEIKGQSELDLIVDDEGNEIKKGGYIYRSIVTNKDKKTNSEIIHWYNQRGEDSENRIKELKRDFGGDVLPCTDFKANALYFLITALSYSVFALMRQLLPEEMAQHRAVTIRWRLYGIAAKVVKTGRQVYVKMQKKQQVLLDKILSLIRRFEPLPT